MIELRISPLKMVPAPKTRVIEPKEYHAATPSSEISWQKEMNLKLDAIMQALGIKNIETPTGKESSNGR